MWFAASTDDSERRACRLVDLVRSTARYAGSVDDDQRRLIERMPQLSRAHPRYGYRRIWAMLRREGWRINRKRVQRLWRLEGLKIPPKAHKQRAPGNSENSCMKRKAEFPNHVWTYDFVADQTEDGRMLRFLAVVDEYTREFLALDVERSMGADEVIAVLGRLIAERGAPQLLRSDNVLTREGKAGEKRRFLGIPYGMCLTTTVPPSGFHEQGLSVRP